MSEQYDAFGNPIGEPDESNQPEGPKWFREGLDKLSKQVKTLQEENASLKQEQRKAKISEALTAKGYAPQAASLYQGEPDQLDDWLGTHGAALAKLSAPEGGQGEGQQEQQAPQGPPPSTVPADQQVQMQQMAQAGTSDTAPPEGADEQMAAQIRSMSPEELSQFMAQQGNRYDWT